MAQFGLHEQQGMMTAERKTSGLAIASLICSLIFCCPVTTVLGVLLGLGALVSIGSNPARKGKGIAFAGIIIGIAGTVLTVWGGYVGYKKFYEPVLFGPREAMTAGFAGDVAGFRAQMHGDAAAASDEEVTAFIETLRARYGEFQSIAFDQTSAPQQPPFGATEAPFPYQFTFANATVSGEATIVFADQNTGQMAMKWSEIVIYDDTMGDLFFPPLDEGGGE